MKSVIPRVSSRRVTFMHDASAQREHLFCPTVRNPAGEARLTGGLTFPYVPGPSLSGRVSWQLLPCQASIFCVVCSGQWEKPNLPESIWCEAK